MPSLPKYRRAKRPTLLVNRKLQRNNKVLVKPRNPIYERLKANNSALAKALSKEKTESQYLFTQNVHLTSQMQERDAAINQRDIAMMGILKNSSELLAYLVESTDRVTRTIAACQQFVGLHRLPSTLATPSPLNAAARRESTRKSSVKSPARGVVQPMVSGHTITKPVINLSRINMPRIRTSPNLSDIEESLSSSPEPNQMRSDAASPSRILRNGPNLMITRRVEGILPERIRLSSPRISNESDRVSDRRSSRLSDRRNSRHSRKFSRSNGNQLSPISPRLNMNEPLSQSRKQSRSSTEGLQNLCRNPRVALEDVSQLLRKCQSLNAQTIFETTNRRESNRNSTIEEPSNSPDAQQRINENVSLDYEASPTYGFDPRLSEAKNQSRLQDPLEGPSWAYNDHSDSDNISGESSPLDMSHVSLADSRTTNNLNKSSRMELRVELSKSLRDLSTKSKQHRSDWLPSSDAALSSDDDLDDDERCQNLDKVMAQINSKKKNSKKCDRLNDIRLPTNVTRRRGQPEIDDDDFTMLIKRKVQQADQIRPDFDINELELPNLEMPLQAPTPHLEPEPEVTTTVRMLTQTIHRMTAMPPGNVSIMGDNSMIYPIRESSVLLTHLNGNTSRESNDGMDETQCDRYVHKRKRKNARQNELTSSDSDNSPASKKSPPQDNNVSRRRDLSSAKVVLEKLEASGTKKRKKNSSSSNFRNASNFESLSLQSLDAQSDSESSNASSGVSGRPRRNKAPSNFAEPKLNTKLRRK